MGKEKLVDDTIVIVDDINIQIAISLQCFLMLVLAIWRLCALDMAMGTLFQSLAVSIVKLSWAQFSLALSFQSLIELGRMLLWFGCLFGLLSSSCNG